jgi:hypothetical protein
VLVCRFPDWRHRGKSEKKKKEKNGAKKARQISKKSSTPSHIGIKNISR